ncbi:hypothetical protein [Pseudomonas sp. NPDC089569]|uniref:hypothetical protein n=1 Tax=Pseudomonas sp. NPDC089569 TaxID=3390722 RepID=UPI003D01B658
MKKVEITILVNDIKETATLHISRAKAAITFSMKNGFRKKYEDQDLYCCLAKIREDNPHIVFLCKGSKLNVMPSRMCSQMAGGVVAYEMKIGMPATFDDIVHIFDYEDNDIVKTLQEQINFYKEWLLSLDRE